MTPPLRLAPAVLLAALAACQAPSAQQPAPPSTGQPPVSATAVAGRLTLDPTHDYGDRYANGMLPVGDGKYRTSGAAKGYVYACGGYAQMMSGGQGGAGTRGPWFSGATYDSRTKAKVQGAVRWTPRMTSTVSGGTRRITTNDLPAHTTGTFPISPSDPAYRYDRNPNRISVQSLTYSLPSAPSYRSPSCMGGESGVMLTGVALFNGFDAGGRDAGAWEVQDACSGHPQNRGEYHYHSLSSCIADIRVTKVTGFALDGFPITGPKVGAHNVLTTRDLDECHGITSTVSLDGRSVTTYHYVMTQDFPYSVSCFRGTATRPPGH